MVLLNSCFKLISNEDTDPTFKTVINLSSTTLSPSQSKVLNRGLTFVPKPQITLPPILSATEAFIRRLKIHDYFKFRGNPFRTKIPYIAKSTWNPPEDKIDPKLVKVIQDFTQDIQSLHIAPENKNLPRDEFLALRQLKSNHSIIIKKADKGSATVIMDKDNYLREGYRQLNNPAHYEKISEPIYPQTASKMRDILLKIRKADLINDKQFRFLCPPQNPRPRYFYMLPKIHKSPALWTIPNQMPPGRPIVSDCESISKNIAKYIDDHIKPFAINHDSYIKDTYDFVRKINSLDIPENCFLATLDVESMYTNIEHDYGLSAMRDAIPSFPPYDSIMELLELTLKSNDFLFDGQWYLQSRGTAMGTDFAPHYADTVLAKFERQVLAECQFKPLVFLRYLDDIFLVWQHGHEKFNDFLHQLNNHAPPIKFKAEVHQFSVDYLDTTVFKDPDNPLKLLTKVFFKPTDTHQLLHKHSFHPKHTFKGIVKSQITRFFRICSREPDFHAAWSILSNALRHRHYSRRWLRQLKQDTFRQLQIIGRIDEPNIINDGPSQISKCGHPRCHTCAIIQLTPTATSTTTGKTHKIIGSLSCSTSNLIYLATCTFCRKQYVGETQTPLKERMHKHHSAIQRRVDSSALYQHLYDHFMDNTTTFYESDYTLSNYDITPLEGINIFPGPVSVGDLGFTRLYRHQRETFWVDTLLTFQPFGLNKRREYDNLDRYKNDKPSIPLVIPFSSTAAKAGKIIKDHIEKLKENDEIERFDYDIIMAYSKHKTIGNQLISSKS